MSVQAKFITKLMHKGKKEKAEHFLLKALKKVEQEILKRSSVHFSRSEDRNSRVCIKMSLVSQSELRSNLLPAKSGLKADYVQSGQSKSTLDQKPLLWPSKLSESGSDSDKKSKKVSSVVDFLSKSPSTQSPKGKNFGTNGKKSIPKKLKSTSVFDEVRLNKILDKIINNAKPLIRLKKVRIAGTTHQKPIALTKKQAETDAIKRIIINANARPEKSITSKLAKEFEEIYFNLLSNKTLTEVRDLHKLAEVNKANITLKS